MTEGYKPFKDSKPFSRQNLEDSKQDTINVYLSPKDREMLEDCKLIMNQSKDSTAFKTLAEIGYTKLVNDKAIGLILERFEAFQRRNARTGIVIVSPKTNISGSSASENMPETEAPSRADAKQAQSKGI